MKAPAFTYHDPKSVHEALDLLARHPGGLPLAGGQSLMPMLNFRVVQPSDLIDLNMIEGLAGIRIADGVGRFGAMTRQRDLEFSDDVARHFPVIQEALEHVGHRQTRNRGTFGGSLCHLDPSAELVNIVCLHDAVLRAASREGTREIAARDWVVDAMTNALEPGELLTEIELPLWPSGHGFAYEEFARRHGDFAIAAVGCLVTLDKGDSIDRAAICISGLSPAPVRLSNVEQELSGQVPSRDLIATVGAAARSLDAMSDVFVTGAYRKRLADVLAQRALTRAFQRAGSAL